MSKFVDGVEYYVEHCCDCNMPFAMTLAFHNKKRRDGEWFFCPSGHRQHYVGPTEESKLRNELERQRTIAEAAQARSTRVERERNEIARAHTRMRDRVMNGVCPCCNRTFQNLLNHMRTEHASELTLRNLREAFGMTQAALAKEVGVVAAYISNFENEKYVPEYAKQSIDNWIARQSPTRPQEGKEE